MGPHENLLDLLLELEILDRVPRFGYLLRGVPDPESVTEHSWHVLFLVWVLADKIPEVDSTQALEMALIHDLAELRIGDLPRTASHYFQRGAKAHAEKGVMEDLLAPLPERVRELYAEYVQGESPEARLVKACDKLQLMIKVTLYEGWGATGLAEFWENPDNFPDGGFQVVRDLFEALRRRRKG